MKVKSRLILAFSIWEILITWAITSTLDYLVKIIVRRFNLRSTHLSQKLRDIWIQVTLLYFVNIEESQMEVYEKVFRKLYGNSLGFSYSRMIETILSSHKRMHKYGMLKAESCRSCQIITRNRHLLQQLVSNPKLYPPFEFSKRI